MAGESRQIVPADFDLEAYLQRQRETPAPPEAHRRPSPEEQQAADAVFAQKHDDAEAAASLVNLWAGSVLLHGLAVDALRKPPAQEEEEAGEKEAE